MLRDATIPGWSRRQELGRSAHGYATDEQSREVVYKTKGFSKTYISACDLCASSEINESLESFHLSGRFLVVTRESSLENDLYPMPFMNS